MSHHVAVEVLDVTDAAAFELLPPCVDSRFDHRTCDYWEDDVRGSKVARASWLRADAPPARRRPAPSPDNPFAPPSREDGFNPFAPPAASRNTDANPFAPQPPSGTRDGDVDRAALPKLRLLQRGRQVFGSYAKVLLVDNEPAGYAQFGPLSAYPRAQAIRELYPALPSAPLPAVITCVATTAAARGRGLARRLVEAVVEDLAERGFAAVEAYPDLTLDAEVASAATPAFWEACGFNEVVLDERYPVMRRELG